MTGTEGTGSFRLGYVPGVTPGKWARIWSERVRDVPLDLRTVSAAEAAATLREGGADACLLRLPVDRTGLSAIPLYTETTVVVVPKDHEVTAVEELSCGDLGEYVVLHSLDDCLEWAQEPVGSDGSGSAPTALPGRPALERPASTADAVELVAAGVGLLIVPQSLARLHHRRDLTYRPVTDAPESRVALAWLEDRTTDLMEEFIGIVRGRTVNSSRGRNTAPKTERTKSEPAQPTRQSPRKPAPGKRGKPRRR